MKKISYILAIILAVSGGIKLFGIYEQRQTQKLIRQNAKAPDVSVTLVEGWTLKEMGGALEKNSVTSAEDFLTAEKNFDSSNYPLLADKPKAADLEGYIFPDTYFLPKNPPAGTNISNLLIQKALDNFSNKITQQLITEAKTHGLDVYQLVTLASIIEKETKDGPGEKQMVAGIFYNRLNAGMALQSDATVAYGVGHANITPDDIAADGPYNTYTRKGLPAGPICNPSLASIQAAANPTPSDYYYFLTNPKTGQAVYAKTYDEHLTNKAKYLR